MVKFKRATPEDAGILALASRQAFEDDINYGAPTVGGPPGYKSDCWQSKMMRKGHYYKIMVDNRIIGGFIIFEKKDRHYVLGRIFVEPAHQNQGIGTQTIRFMEEEFSTAKKWTLDTPQWAVRNHHFYKKMGYMPVASEDNDCVLYEKQMKKQATPPTIAPHLSPEKLTAFIVKAKAATYVGDGAKSVSYRPSAHSLQFYSDDFGYLDSYFGGADFLGQEVVYHQNTPVWAMNYYGRILEPSLINGEKAGRIIKESLSAMYEEGRFLGGFEYHTPHGVYIDTSEGDVTSFTGKEWITCNGVTAYELVYHGGDSRINPMVTKAKSHSNPLPALLVLCDFAVTLIV